MAPNSADSSDAARIKILASLLDDPDDNIAVKAIAELLKLEQSLGDLPATWQESGNPLLRKRAHQLQSALVMRQRRKALFDRLNSGKFDFFEALVDIHLLWFDNDPRAEIANEVRQFRRKARAKKLSSLTELSLFMQQNNIAAAPESTLHPENYCIGTILADKCGAASILAALGKHLLAEPEKFTVVSIYGDFAIADSDGNVLIPAHGWQLHKDAGLRQAEKFTPGEILKFCEMNLFSCAVNSDSFRYILTIAQTISGTSGDEILQKFPYPYNVQGK